MKYRIFVGLLLCLILIMATGNSAIFALSQAQTGEATPSTASGIAATLGNTITYQGYLVQHGSPVTATCDFVFALFDAASGGEFVVDASATVPVTEGQFTALLDFGSAAFTGGARWMQVYVRCPSTVGSYTPLSGRVELTAVPYAHSLRPGAQVFGTAGVTLNVRNSAEDGVAIQGEATSLATASDYQAFGGRFTSRSRGGVGVYGGDNDTGDYSFGYGVWGKSTSHWGYGVYGENASPDGYGVYSAGNAHVQGELTWQPKTSYISVPAAAFIPYASSLTPVCHDPYYINIGDRLTVYDSPCTVSQFEAPVILPHDATVTAMTFHYYDRDSGRDATVTLWRDFDEQLATVTSSGDDGFGSNTTTAINYARVDNQNHTYFLEATLVTMQWVDLRFVVIEYTINAPY
ncbi:MAG: hypothetical protein RBT75_05775 [Anaerolineae bacterium]|jgi:hypothetical protein|nr:hypothetical protein [Anaerolineae bacterium]